MQQPLSVLFVDDNNASRTRMAEAILRAQGGDDFLAASAGVEPQAIDPHTRELLAQFDMEPGPELGEPFERVADRRFDFVIVLRDEHGGEPALPIAVPSGAITWDVPDPAKAGGDHEEREHAYRRVFELLRQRIQVFILAQHDELRERGSDQVIGAQRPKG